MFALGCKGFEPLTYRFLFRASPECSEGAEVKSRLLYRAELATLDET
jgi:hypothetical protein